MAVTAKVGNKKFIWINGKQFPEPDMGLRIEREQIVNQGRNLKGQVIAQRINRRLIKLADITWSYLTAEQWHWVLNQVNAFRGTIRFWDAGFDQFITLDIYWGDAAEEPFQIAEDGRILSYRNCKVSAIDMGTTYIPNQ